MDVIDRVLNDKQDQDFIKGLIDKHLSTLDRPVPLCVYNGDIWTQYESDDRLGPCPYRESGEHATAPISVFPNDNGYAIWVNVSYYLKLKDGLNDEELITTFEGDYIPAIIQADMALRGDLEYGDNSIIWEGVEYTLGGDDGKLENLIKESSDSFPSAEAMGVTETEYASIVGMTVPWEREIAARQIAIMCKVYDVEKEGALLLEHVAKPWFHEILTTALENTVDGKLETRTAMWDVGTPIEQIEQWVTAWVGEAA